VGGEGRRGWGWATFELDLDLDLVLIKLIVVRWIGDVKSDETIVSPDGD